MSEPRLWWASSGRGLRRRRRSRACIALIASCALAAACVSKQKKLDEKERAELAQLVVSALPAAARPLNVDFNGKVTLLGYELEPGTDLKPKQEVKLKLYWRLDQALDGKGWQLFTHLLDGAGERVRNIDDVGPLRRRRGGEPLLPPTVWLPGKIYVDEQTFTLPKKMKTETAELVTGIYRGKERLPIRSGPSREQNRALVATLKVTSDGVAQAGPAGARVPELEAERLPAGVEIVLDGKLDEPVWQKAAATGPFVNPATGERDEKAALQGSTRVLWNDHHVYLGFQVSDVDIRGGFKPRERDQQLWTRDCVEIMIDPDGDGDNRDYYEIQISPENLVFDSQFDAYNQPRKDPAGPFGHQDWTAELASAVVLDGTLKSGDLDQGYSVEARIAWKSFAKAKQVPPKAGDEWRLNFYAMENNGGVSWSPILKQGNFHKASRFGKVRWVEKRSEEAAREPPLRAINRTLRGIDVQRSLQLQRRETKQ